MRESRTGLLGRYGPVIPGFDFIKNINYQNHNFYTVLHMINGLLIMIWRKWVKFTRKR